MQHDNPFSDHRPQSLSEDRHGIQNGVLRNGESSLDFSCIVNLLLGFQKSKVMFTAARFGVFDRLEHSPAGFETLAVELNVNPDALERLLNACVCLGLLQKNSSAKYTNTDVTSVYLCSSAPKTLISICYHLDKAVYKMWENFEDAVREGSNRWRETFNIGDNMFVDFFRDPKAKCEFLLGMHGFATISSPPVVSAFDLSPFKRMVDLGGGSGQLVIAACERYPNLVGVVFDLPHVVEFTREIVIKSSVANRIEVIDGDFFKDEFPEADLYSLGWVIHVLKEDKVKFLLKKIADRLPSGGGLLIAESVLNDEKTGPFLPVMLSLTMLVQTQGKERSFGEYRVLLHGAGFDEVSLKLTGLNVDAILAIKR